MYSAFLTNYEVHSYLDVDTSVNNGYKWVCVRSTKPSISYAKSPGRDPRIFITLGTYAYLRVLQAKWTTLSEQNFQSIFCPNIEIKRGVELMMRADTKNNSLVDEVCQNG